METPLKFERVEKRPNWSRVIFDAGDDELIELARELNRKRDKGVYYVFALLPDDNNWEVRDGFRIGQRVEERLYRVETNDPVEIARACEVGGHAAWYGTSVEAVCEQLAAIHSQNPILPFLANDAAFQCEFEQPITDEFGAFLDENVMEGCEAYADENDGGFADFIRRDGYLQLWWD